MTSSASIAGGAGGAAGGGGTAHAGGTMISSFAMCPPGIDSRSEPMLARGSGHRKRGGAQRLPFRILID